MRPLVARQACLEALGRIGTAHPEVVPALMATLRAADDGDAAAVLREGAADAVALIGPAAAPVVPALIRAAGDAHEPVRRKVFIALGTMGGQTEIALPTMIEAMAFDESPAVRDAAEEALAKVGPAAIPALVQVLRDDDVELRLRAARALRRMGGIARSAKNDLRTALHDADAGVRIEAAGALLQLTDDPGEYLPTLVECLTSRERGVRMQASQLLIDLGPPARPAASLLEDLLDHERPEVRRLAAETLKKMKVAPPAR